MPVGGMGGSKSPDNGFTSQAGFYVLILGNVDWIIKGYKVMIPNLPIDGNRSQNQENANGKVTSDVEILTHCNSLFSGFAKALDKRKSL
jgi:hypothetical protein